MSNDSNIKIIAFHLPQYYSFKENDLWWGKGFTDWDNVKKAQPLFKNHYQPKVPLNNNYYNMTEIDTLIRQSDLSLEYGIFGFCYYHYWFNGKLLLERPIELLLKNSNINQKYCLCWANEPWTRSWNGREQDIIMPQIYGDKLDYERHYRYLANYFNDNRYIKINNKPVFVIYRANSIPNFDEMVSKFNAFAVNDGFSGVYFIEEINGFQSSKFSKFTDAILEFEPTYARAYRRSILKKFYHKISRLVLQKFNVFYNKYSYDLVWRDILKLNQCNSKLYYGGFVNFDNTPRRKKDGTVIQGTPNKFKKYLKLQIERAKKNNSDYIFLNAWNEWAEGCYLEPDEKNGYAYLEALRDALIETGEFTNKYYDFK